MIGFSLTGSVSGFGGSVGGFAGLPFFLLRDMPIPAIRMITIMAAALRMYCGGMEANGDGVGGTGVPPIGVVTGADVGGAVGASIKSSFSSVISAKT